jgi:hypothetical protein
MIVGPPDCRDPYARDGESITRRELIGLADFSVVFIADAVLVWEGFFLVPQSRCTNASSFPSKSHLLLSQYFSGSVGDSFVLPIVNQNGFDFEQISRPVRRLRATPFFALKTFQSAISFNPLVFAIEDQTN